MNAPTPILARDMLERASRALGKVDLHGRRGVTMLSLDETEALALVAASCGLIPTRPGDPLPAAFFIPSEKDTK